MPETPRYYVWPIADERTLTLAILFLLGLFAGAVLLEFYRRRKDRRLRLDAEWRAVRDMCHDRELLDEDFHLLRAIISRFAAETPYKAVTKRLLFDECMGKYFHVLDATADEEAIAQHGVQLRDVRTRLGLDYVPLGRRIYSTRELYTGQALWAAPAAGHDPQWFHFTVASVDEAHFRVEPVGTDSLPAFAAGDLLKLRLWREEDARYLFEARIQKIEQGPAAWVMGHVEDLIRNQARAHFRVRFDQAADINILNATLNDDYSNLDARPSVTHLRGRITSLSGGGLAVVFQQPVPKQVLLRLHIALPGQAARLTAHVRPVGSQVISGGRSLLRGKFVAMDGETQEAITRYVFQKQKQNASDDKY